MYTYSLNLNQWIIIDIKYAIDNQWINCEIPDLANLYYVM